MSADKDVPLVLFNASVVLAGIRSSHGGSRVVLKWAYSRKIRGFISEIILDEALRHADKITHSADELQKEISAYFPHIVAAPPEALVKKMTGRVLDPGDAHLLATAKEHHAQFLVSLDKRHILILKDKVGELTVVSPGELIALLG